MYMVLIKLIFVVITINFFSTNAFAEKCTSKFSLSFQFTPDVGFVTPDVGFENQYYKSLDKNFKKHGVCIVEKSKGHPTRLGKQSLRFEVKSGDCGYDNIWDDCKNDRERHELSSSGHNDGEYWYSWSIFLPDDFINVYPVKLAMGQFNQIKGRPVWMFQNARGGYFVDNQVYGYTSRKDRILNQKEMLGKWNDIIINSKWTHLKDGFFRVWVNGKLLLSHSGPTKTEGKKVIHKFGIYRSFVKRFKNYHNIDKVPGQVVYFDEVRTTKTCSKLKLKDLGYNCQVLLASIN